MPREANSVDPQCGPGVKDNPIVRDQGMARFVRAVAGLATSVAVFMAPAVSGQTVAPPVDVAQDKGRLEALARSLSDGVSCTSGAPRDGLDERGRKSGASQADIGAALAIISSSGDVCVPVRMAASAMSAELVARQAAAFQAAQPAETSSGASAAAQASLANAALDAEARAASTRFTVGPPPRNLTRGRISGL